MLPVGQFFDTSASVCGGIGFTGSSLARLKEAHAARHSHEIHSQFQRIAAAFGLDLICAFLEVVTGNGPSVFPEQRTNAQYTAAALVQIGLVMAGEFLNAVAQIQQDQSVPAQQRDRWHPQRTCRRL